MEIFTVSGFRGIVGEGFTPEKVWEYTRKFALFMNTDTLLVGRDTRPSGEEVLSFIKERAIYEGFKIMDAGIVPTPTLVFGTREFSVPGIMITASHNPPQWNGMKFIHREGRFLFKEEIEEFKNYNEKMENRGRGDIIEVKELIKKHVDTIKKVLKLNKKDTKGLRIGIDPVNGAGKDAAFYLFKGLGIEFGAINETPGSFGRNPVPTPENLGDFHSFILINGFDIGFALDPDADRLSLVLKKGPISEEYTFVLSSIALKKNIRKGVVCNLSTSKMIDAVAHRYNWDVIRTPVGEANVVKAMIERGYNMGGEGNGGVIFGDINSARDSLVGMASIIKLMVESSIEEVIDELPSLYMKKMKFKYSKNMEEKIMKEFKGGEFNRDDGIRIDFEDYWIHVRKSNTEPVVRVIVEATSPELLNSIVDKVRKICVE